MANPTYRASTTAGSTTGLSQSISSPSTTAVGDLLTVVYSGYSQGTYSPTPTLPSGWTLLKEDIQTGSGFTIHAYTAEFVATAAGAQAFTFGTSMTPNTAYGCDLAMFGCYNQNTSTPVDDSQVATVPNGTTATSPAATATVANDLIFCVYIDGGNTGATPSLPSGLTSAVAYQDSTNGTGIRVGYATVSATGTTPTYTSTFGETVDPANGIFGSMFTVLVKSTSTGSNNLSGTSPTQENANGTLSNIPPSLPLYGVSAAQESGSANLAVGKALAATSEQQQTAKAQPGTWALEQVYQITQKWKVGTYSPTNLSITCNQGDSLIVLTNQWNANSSGTFVPSISPGSLTPIYDPESTYLGTAEPVYAQAFAAFDLAAGTYTVTPANLGGTAGDGDTYVLRFSGVAGLRTYGYANEGGGSTTTGNYTSITATLQAAAVAGDCLVAIGGTDNNTTVTTLVVSAPSGWTNAANQTDGTNSPPSSVDYTTATGGAQSVTYTWPNEASPVGEAIILALIPAASNPVSLSGSALQEDAASGTLAIQKAAIGLSQQQDSASGALTVAVPLSAVSLQTQSANGAVKVGVPVSGYASAAQQANGSITISVPLSATAVQQALASAGLIVGVPMAGASGQSQGASAALSIGVGMRGTSGQQQTSTGTLGIHVALDGTALQQAIAAATLSNAAPGAVALAGASGQRQYGAGMLSVGDVLSGASLAIQSASGSLATGVPISGSSVQASRANGALTVGVTLSGSAAQHALTSAALSNIGAIDLAASASQQQGAAGTLMLQIHLDAASVQQVANVATLGNSTITTYPSNQRYYATAPSRSLYATAPSRSLYATAPSRSLYATP